MNANLRQPRAASPRDTADLGYRCAIEQRTLPSALLHLMRGFHIATGTKAATSPGQHDDTRLGIVTGADNGLIQLFAQGVSQSV